MKNIVNKQLIVIVSIFLVLLVGLAFFVAKPRFNTFLGRYKSLSESQNKLAALTAKKESLIKLKKDETRIEAALKKAEGLLPDQKQTSDFIVQLEAASLQTGNTLKSINMVEAPKKTTVQKEEGESKTEETKETTTPEEKKEGIVTFSINLTGNFKQLLDFLTLANSLSRFVSFPSLTISNIGGNIIESKLEGEIYYK